MSEYALWLMPDHTNMKKFRSVISRLAEEHLSEIFEPHVTLLQVKTPLTKDALGRAKKLAEEIGSFDMNLKKTDHEDSFFRCVILRAEITEKLAAAHKRAAEIFGVDASGYMPHLSLLYADMPEQRRKEIMKDVGNLSGKIKTESLWLVRNDRPGTKTTRYWHVEAKLPLA